MTGIRSDCVSHQKFLGTRAGSAVRATRRLRGLHTGTLQRAFAVALRCVEPEGQWRENLTSVGRPTQIGLDGQSDAGALRDGKSAESGRKPLSRDGQAVAGGTTPRVVWSMALAERYSMAPLTFSEGR